MNWVIGLLNLCTHLFKYLLNSFFEASIAIGVGHEIQCKM